MPKELPDQKTPVRTQDMIYAFGRAWINLFNEQPHKESLVLLLAHTSLETGIGYPSAHCFNFGNIKADSNGQRNYTYYKCNELVKLDTARAMVTSASKDGGNAYISGVRADGCAWVNFEPKNRYCCFRAFETMEEGAVDYLNFLYTRYKKDPNVWNALINHNPQLYCHYLRQNGYYTADEVVYTNSVMRLYNQFLSLEFDPDKLPILSEAQQQRISDLVAITLQDSIDTMKLDKSDTAE